jgi:hypothetical protein
MQLTEGNGLNQHPQHQAIALYSGVVVSPD